MNIIRNPERSRWAELLLRPQVEQADLEGLVLRVFEDIRQNGDRALRRYALEFDRVDMPDFAVPASAVRAALQNTDASLLDALRLAKDNIERFHAAQVETKRVVETAPGVFCWRESRAIERVGIYIPGGTAPLFSTVLMLGVPARLAGCKEIVLCTPPDKSGAVHPAILAAAALVGIERIFALGGIQAIGALTLGTESIPRVDKIFGPGNQYVTAAKQLAQRFGTPIDMPAGPSEVLVVADNSCDPAFVAADLLSQAEHGADSQVILASNSEAVVEQVLQALGRQLQALPRKAIAEQALQHSKAFVMNTIEDCLALSNAYAPEHLILALAAPYEPYIALIEHAGSVFLGHYSCESAGDYASGTNHTLPTNGYARNYSGVSLDSFVKKITFQELRQTGILHIGPAIERMAQAEQLWAHKNAVTLRLERLKQ